jgi:alkyl sulfatase BDS1-like metallo-beta-lactamase superfamily hydrolase
VPKFGAEPGKTKMEEGEDSDDSYYDLENNESARKHKPGHENQDKPLKLSDLKFLKLMVQEVKIQNQEIQTNLNLEGDNLLLELTVPLPDPQKGEISNQMVRSSNFTKTALGTF